MLLAEFAARPAVLLHPSAVRPDGIWKNSYFVSRFTSAVGAVALPESRGVLCYGRDDKALFDFAQFGLRDSNATQNITSAYTFCERTVEFVGILVFRIDCWSSHVKLSLWCRKPIFGVL